MSSPHGHADSQSSQHATFAQGPRFSPPKSPSKSTSPVRKPLHERSNSQTNQYSGPTIRIVEDPGHGIYQKYPVPSEPSQILPPPRHAPGYGFERPERPGSRVSSGSKVANTIAKFEATRALAPQPVLSRKKGFRHSASTSISEEDTFISSSFSPSSTRFSQGSTAPSSPPPEFDDFESGLDVLEEEPSFERSTIRPVPPSSSGGDSSESRTSALTLKASAASFASTVHPASTPSISNAGNPASVSVGRPLPPRPHDRSIEIQDEAGGSAARTSDTDHRQTVLKSQSSTESITFSDISSTSIEPIQPVSSSQPSPTLHEASTSTFASGIRVNYPIVRAPSSNSLRAESQRQQTIASRMQDRSLVHNWSSQLSTIASVSERDSRSFVRSPRTSGARSQSQESYAGQRRTSLARRRGHTVGSGTSWSRSESVVSSEPNTETSAVPRPLFSPVARGSSEERDYYSEHLDTISPLPSSVPLRKKTSGYLQRSNSTDAVSMTDSRPGSSQSNVSSFFSNNIPTWARVYYRRGERISVVAAPESDSSGSIRLGTAHSGRSHTPSESHFPLSIYRPRNRPRTRMSHTDTVSLADDVQSIDGGVYEREVYMVEDRGQMYALSAWSTPHLRTDQRGQLRYSAWNAPSLDADVHQTLFRASKQTDSALLFRVPVPSRQADIEQQFAQAVAPADDKAFQKATWWRNLNRIMSGVGTLLVGVIIALAILASKLSDR
ncbi:serine-rich [Pyrenophora seminiperda CCB06]|uniref:Serine-rich n=1 Tax=Pyrenophora seminiperda CCB06 TaxID=1302712 RepID=A0A3M7LY77_9PLEO|nr:serine-rich [Pyrenophora seminiperda CCB06]